MEQARYWMWAKTKPDLNPRLLTPISSYGDSWEEQAFAEDAAGTLGGCVWPPRSYSCSFCRREFRSAQALGGHMNVHRRDRARLKQSSHSPNDVVPQNHALNACTSFEAPYSSQICTFLYNNPNPEFSDTGPLVSPLSHVLRVSPPPPAKVNTEENISTTLRFVSPLVQKIDKDSVVSSLPPPSWSSFLSGKRDRASDSTKNDDEKKAAGVDPGCRAEKEDCVTEDLSISLNLVVCQAQTKTSSDEEVASCKRRRIEAKPVSFLPKLSAVERCLAQSEALKLRPVSSADELDLELRLGNAPKVK